jgi:hypothetical protein
MYKIVIELENVAEGDATTLAQEIWDEHSEGLDADRGDFKLSISRDGFLVDWTPSELA